MTEQEIRKNGPRFIVSGAGVMQITAREILKSPKVLKQLEAIKDIKVSHD